MFIYFLYLVWFSLVYLFSLSLDICKRLSTAQRLNFSVLLHILPLAPCLCDSASALISKQICLKNHLKWDEHHHQPFVLVYIIYGC